MSLEYVGLIALMCAFDLITLSYIFRSKAKSECTAGFGRSTSQYREIENLITFTISSAVCPS